MHIPSEKYSKKQFLNQMMHDGGVFEAFDNGLRPDMLESNTDPSFARSVGEAFYGWSVALLGRRELEELMKTEGY